MGRNWLMDIMPTLSIERIITILREHYRALAREPGGRALDQLVGTILSQNTSDVNSARAYASLRARFATWETVRLAPIEDIAEAIRCGGLAEQKAPRIKDLLERLERESGQLSLEFLRDLPTADARTWLLRLPGVGAKTAACVLLFALGRDVFPVDTHVERVCKRLGLAPNNASPETIEALLEEQTPPGMCLEGHLLLIEHGRRACRARNPLCEVCPLRRGCDFCSSRHPAPEGLGVSGQVCHTGPG